MAELKRKVDERNHNKREHPVKDIDYQHPAQWKLDIHFKFLKVDAEWQMNTRCISSQFEIDRLTTKGEVLQKCLQVWNSKFWIEASPEQRDSSKVLSLFKFEVKLSNLFETIKSIAIGKHEMNLQDFQDSEEVFLSDERANDQTITIKVDRINERLIKSLVNQRMLW